MNINKFLLIIFCKRLLQKIKILPKKKELARFSKKFRIESNFQRSTKPRNIIFSFVLKYKTFPDGTTVQPIVRHFPTDG